MRRDGTTTRLIDTSIQKLFKEGETKIVDHHGTTEANKRMMHIFKSRLNNEHGLREDGYSVRKKRSRYYGIYFIIKLAQYNKNH